MTSACNVHYALKHNHSVTNTNERDMTSGEKGLMTGTIIAGIGFWPIVIAGLIIGGPAGPILAGVLGVTSVVAGLVASKVSNI